MLTFEKIRELERNERDSKKLQKLPADVMDELRDYMGRKTKTTTSADIMELENVKNTIRRFFELREQKILSGVLDTIRTGLPLDNMTAAEEREFYEMVDVAKRFRESFFEELRKPVAEEKQSVYRVKKSLPEFVGPDMKTYQLKENDVIVLPKELEEFLTKEGVVEKVEQ